MRNALRSLGFGPNCKSVYCMAVCPAGADVIGPYLASKKDFTDEGIQAVLSFVIQIAKDRQ